MVYKLFTSKVFSSKLQKRLAWMLLAVSMLVAVSLSVQAQTQAITARAIKFTPRITVRSGGFYTSTLQSFVPRGSNFVRLATSPSGQTYHSVFEPGQYNPANIQTTLTGMQNSGYNVVRVFIDPGEFTTPSHGISTAVGSTTPLNTAYMANIVDFVKQAGAKGIYTIPVIDGVPANTYYYRTAGSPTGDIQGRNVMYLDSRYVQAKEEYVKQFVGALTSGLTSTQRSYVLAYQTDNEIFFDASQAPFNTMSGTLTSLDGITYDMSQSSQRQQAVDANLAVYAARMKQAVSSVDSQALFTLGFFTNNAVGKTAFTGLVTSCGSQCSASDYWFPGRPAAVTSSGKVDFVDMHTYSWGEGYSVTNDLASSEYSLFQKPYVIGEFGTTKAAYNNDVISAAYGMRDLQIASCSIQAKGWMFWTWDTSLVTSLANQNLFYSLADNGGAINGQLASVARPDPCR